MSSDTSIKYSRASKLYDLVEWPMEQLLFKVLRKKAIAKVSGKVLEVGVGTGKNFPYYDKKDIELTAIDFSIGMLDIAKEKKKQMCWPELKLIQMNIEDLKFDDECFDMVVSTFVFCSVPDPEQGLKEIYRVLKPGGKAIFIEHMKSRYSLLNVFLKIMNFFSTRILGASMIRETQNSIEKVGFKIESVEYKLFDIFRLIVASKE